MNNRYFLAIIHLTHLIRNPLPVILPHVILHMSERLRHHSHELLRQRIHIPDREIIFRRQADLQIRRNIAHYHARPIAHRLQQGNRQPFMARRQAIAETIGQQ